jgi:S-adenosylmethionine synthetase
MGMQGSYSVLALTVQAAATLAANRFIEADGTYPAAGGSALGVTRFAGVSGDQMTVDCLGTAIVEAGGAIAVKGACKVDAAGKVLAHDSTNKIVAMALTAAAADGDLIHVLLIPNA